MASPVVADHRQPIRTDRQRRVIGSDLAARVNDADLVAEGLRIQRTRRSRGEEDGYECERSPQELPAHNELLPATLQKSELTLALALPRDIREKPDYRRLRRLGQCSGMTPERAS